MKEFVQHPVYGEIIYSENIWTGKKALTVNGVEAQTVSKKEYLISGKKALLKGNYLTSVNMYLEDETIRLVPKTKWYEWILAILTVLFFFTWGNNATLCTIFPVIGGAIGGTLGGAIGGGLGGAAMVISLSFMKKQKSILAKILIGAAVFAAAVFVGFILAFSLILIFALI